MERIIEKVQWSIPAQPKATRVAAYANPSQRPAVMDFKISKEFLSYILKKSRTRDIMIILYNRGEDINGS